MGANNALVVTGQAADPIVAAHAAEIRRLGQRIVADVVEIGRRLTECRARVGHGHWQTFLDREFSWSESTALNFIRVFDLAKTKSTNFADLALPVSSLYLLAAPSTPEEARTEIFERAKAGEQMSGAEVKKTIAKAKTAANGGRKSAAKKAKSATTEPDEVGTDENCELATEPGDEAVELAIKDISLVLNEAVAWLKEGPPSFDPAAAIERLFASVETLVATKRAEALATDDDDDDGDGGDDAARSADERKQRYAATEPDLAAKSADDLSIPGDLSIPEFLLALQARRQE